MGRADDRFAVEAFLRPVDERFHIRDRRARILIEVSANRGAPPVRNGERFRSDENCAAWRQGAVFAGFVLIARQRRVPVRKVALNALQDDLAECVLKNRLPVVSRSGDRLPQAIHFGAGQLDAAIASPASPDRRSDLRRRARGRRDPRSRGGSEKRPIARTYGPLFQLFDFSRPSDQPIAVNIHLDRGKHTDLAIGAAHNAGDWLPAVELPSIVGTDGNRRSKERKGIETAWPARRPAPQPKDCETPSRTQMAHRSQRWCQTAAPRAPYAAVAAAVPPALNHLDGRPPPNTVRGARRSPRRCRENGPCLFFRGNRARSRPVPIPRRRRESRACIALTNGRTGIESSGPQLLSGTRYQLLALTASLVAHIQNVGRGGRPFGKRQRRRQTIRPVVGVKHAHLRSFARELGDDGSCVAACEHSDSSMASRIFMTASLQDMNASRWEMSRRCA